MFGVMQVTVGMLLECPILLMGSLGKRMGPRFLLSLVAQDKNNSGLSPWSTLLYGQV